MVPGAAAKTDGVRSSAECIGRDSFGGAATRCLQRSPQAQHTHAQHRADANCANLPPPEEARAIAPIMEVKPRLRRRKFGEGSKHSLGGRPLKMQEGNRSTAVALTPDMLRACFGMPLHEAARTLGICATAVKKCCRKMGIMQWPFQRLKPIQSRLVKLQASPSKETPEVKREIRDLQAQQNALMDIQGLDQCRHAPEDGVGHIRAQPGVARKRRAADREGVCVDASSENKTESGGRSDDKTSMNKPRRLKTMALLVSCSGRTRSGVFSRESSLRSNQSQDMLREGSVRGLSRESSLQSQHPHDLLKDSSLFDQSFDAFDAVGAYEDDALPWPRDIGRSNDKTNGSAASALGCTPSDDHGSHRSAKPGKLVETDLRSVKIAFLDSAAATAVPPMPPAQTRLGLSRESCMRTHSDLMPNLPLAVESTLPGAPCNAAAALLPQSRSVSSALSTAAPVLPGGVAPESGEPRQTSRNASKGSSAGMRTKQPIAMWPRSPADLVRGVNDTWNSFQVPVDY